MTCEVMIAYPKVMALDRKLFYEFLEVSSKGCSCVMVSIAAIGVVFMAPVMILSAWF